MKSKWIILMLGLSVALAGCGSSGYQKTDGNKVSSTASSQQTSDSKTGSSGSDKSSGTATNTTGGTNQTNGDTASSSPSTDSPKPPSKNPAPNTLNMSPVTAVRLADSTTGWAGGKGWIAKTINGGKSWTVVYQGNWTVQQIFALNHSDVWFVMNPGGKYSKLFYSSDGGQNWNLVATTSKNAFLHFNSKMIALCGNYLSQEGGKSWRELPVPSNTVGDAYFDNGNVGWVVTKNNNEFNVKRTANGGKTWETVLTKSIAASLEGAQIRSAGPNDAWIELIGGTGMSQTSYSVFHTADGGKSWRTVIANSTAGGGPAPGFSQDVNTAYKNKGSKPGPLYVVNSEAAFMGGSCPACDDPNSIGWTKNGGTTWVNSNFTLKGYGDSLLAFADENNGWWVTTDTQNPSIMYTTSDGGVNWKQVYAFH